VATESLRRTSYAPESTVTPRQPRTSRVDSGATAETRAESERWLAAGLLVIASGLAVVALLGPLAFEVIEYRITETLRNQMIGLDAVSLFVVAPLALLAAVLALRGHVSGPALALGIGAYTSYMFVQYILGPDYAHLPGDNERLFPLVLLLFACGWALALAGWRALDVARIARSRRRDLVLGRVVLPVLGFLAFFRYLPALADAMSSTPEDGGYLAGPSFFWAIAMLDLGVFLPLTVVACIGLVRDAPWAQKALYAVVGWFGLVGPAVAAMAIAMYVNDDPTASAGLALFMTGLGLAFALLAVVLYRPLFGSRT
jgi:hypothetical protein